MIAVIFEVWVKPEYQQGYLDMAAALRKELDRIEGFISIERFQSFVETGKILSLSFWRDEKAIQDWRTLETHRAAQYLGRAKFFKDYRLRIAAVVRDYGMNNRAQHLWIADISTTDSLWLDSASFMEIKIQQFSDIKHSDQKGKSCLFL